MNVEIRHAVSSDIEEMSELTDCAWRENYRDIFTGEVIEKYTGKHRRESFAKLIDRCADIRVLTVDGRIAALCAFQPLENERGLAKIILMYVHPNDQRQGLGKQLLSYVLDELSGSGYFRAVLDTAEKNAGARRFYEALGFSPEKQYENGIGYVTYMKRL